MKLPIVAGLIALVAAPAAWAFRADNYHEVNPVSRTTFEVISRPGAGASQFWCAAGDYTVRALGMAGATRVYLVAPRGPSLTVPGAQAVTFSLVAPETVVNGALTLSMRRVGDNLSAAFARQYCFDDRVREF